MPGYALQWSSDGCTEHPQHGHLPIRMVQGCLMVSETCELEQEGRRKAHVRIIMACEVMVCLDVKRSFTSLTSVGGRSTMLQTSGR